MLGPACMNGPKKHAWHSPARACMHACMLAQGLEELRFPKRLAAHAYALARACMHAQGLACLCWSAMVSQSAEGLFSRRIRPSCSGNLTWHGCARDTKAYQSHTPRAGPTHDQKHMHRIGDARPSSDSSSWAEGIPSCKPMLIHCERRNSKPATSHEKPPGQTLSTPKCQAQYLGREIEPSQSHISQECERECSQAMGSGQRAGHHLQEDVDFAMLVFGATPHVEGALLQRQGVQFRQLLLAHRHILKLAAVSQHRQELQGTEKEAPSEAALSGQAAHT